MKRKQAEEAGRKAEDKAAQWLTLKGWKILDKRRKTPGGEIDLIARKNGIVAFVEVKWRKNADALDQAIDSYRLRRVASAVEIVAHEYMRKDDDIRIDVILLAPRTIPRHIVNAWQP